MSDIIETLAERLYGQNGLGIKDIKISMNETSNATDEEIAEQISKVLDQIERGDFELVENFDSFENKEDEIKISKSEFSNVFLSVQK